MASHRLLVIVVCCGRLHYYRSLDAVQLLNYGDQRGTQTHTHAMLHSPVPALHQHLGSRGFKLLSMPTFLFPSFLYSFSFASFPLAWGQIDWALLGEIEAVCSCGLNVAENLCRESLRSSLVLCVFSFVCTVTCV